MRKRIPRVEAQFLTLWNSYQIALPEASAGVIAFDFHLLLPPVRWTFAKKTLFVAGEIKYTWDEI
jgi:hypothetical protein